MISARDELRHLADCFTDEECERAVALLTQWFHVGPRCPDCGERDLDRLEWQDDEQVTCQTCNFCWDPNHHGPLRRPKGGAE